MRPTSRLVASLVLCALAGQAHAWSQPTHKNIVKDALAYMNSPYATEEMRQAYAFYVGAAGSEAKAGEILGQAAYDVDDFRDTRLGGWWVGYEYAPVWNAAAKLVNYTSYWHFLNMGRQGDAHGNPHGGYDYRYHKVDGTIADVDWYAKVYLYNRELKREDFDTTEAHYRRGSRSNWQEHYGDFQTAAFQPIDNLAGYWFDQFRAAPRCRPSAMPCTPPATWPSPTTCGSPRPTATSAGKAGSTTTTPARNSTTPPPWPTSSAATTRPAASASC